MAFFRQSGVICRRLRRAVPWDNLPITKEITKMSTYTGGGTTRTRGAPQGGGQGSRLQPPRPIAEPAAGPAHTGAKALAAGLIGSAALVIPAAAAWASPSSILPAVPHTGSTASTASGLGGPGTQFRTSAIEQPIVAAKSSSPAQHHNGQPGTARSRVAEATLTAVVRPRIPLPTRQPLSRPPARLAPARSAGRLAQPVTTPPPPGPVRSRGRFPTVP